MNRENCLENLKRELIPYYSTDKHAKYDAGSKSMNIISLNSIAAIKLNIDIGLDYVIKAATLQAAKVIGIKNKTTKITSNIVMFGEVINEDVMQHNKEKSVYEQIKEYTTAKKVSTYQSVVHMVSLLVSRQLPGINRQIIKIDEEIENISIESMIRREVSK